MKAVKHHHANDKPDFVPLGQMYIKLVEITATLEHILCCVHDKWGETTCTYYIFTADGLVLEESAETQGLLNL